MKGKIGRRKADGDAVLGRDKAGGPAEGRAGAAQRADQDAGDLPPQVGFDVHGIILAPAQVTWARLIL